MEMTDIMRMRHSVRQYRDKKIEADKREALEVVVKACNEESGLHIQILYDEPGCFSSRMAHYGSFKGVKSYIALVGKKSAELDEKAGYYGEKLVLEAQKLGLNTCWVALTHGKSAARVEKGEKLACVIALGYGVNQGVPHKNKELKKLCNYENGMPDWFLKAMEAVLLAPTAMNQQKFYFTYENGRVQAKAGRGFYTKMDLGIAKYHFETVHPLQ